MHSNVRTEQRIRCEYEKAREREKEKEKESERKNHAQREEEKEKKAECIRINAFSSVRKRRNFTSLASSPVSIDGKSTCRTLCGH